MRLCLPSHDGGGSGSGARAVAGLAACLLCCVAGCATTGASGGASGGGGAAPRAAPFPSRSELAQVAVAAAARPAQPPREPTAVLERWELAGPFPTVMGAQPSQEATPFVSLLRAQAERTGGRMMVTESMQCATRELGRYMMGHEGGIPQPIADFVMGRCGSVGTFLGAWSSRGTAPGGDDEQHLVAEFRDRLAHAAQEFVASGDGPVNAGAWFGRAGTRFFFIMAMESRRVLVDPRPFTADESGRVVIEGRTLEATQSLSAFINRGRWASQRCEVDAAVRMPRFRVLCPLDPQDAVARLEISAMPPGRMLGHTVFSAVVGPGRDASRVFDVHAADASRVTTDPAEARASLIAAVNEVRAQAGVGPVELAAREADAACQVTPAYFSAATDGDMGSGTDRIALGLMAGWDVTGGTIRDGSFLSGAGAEDDDMDRWVSWALERPLGRHALLGADVRQVAVCPWTYEGHTHGVLWSSYRFFTEGTQAQEVSRVYERIDAARRAAGTARVQRLSQLEAPMKAHAQSLEHGAADLNGSLEAMLQLATERTGEGTRGWVIPTTDIEAIEFPREMLAQPTLRAAVQVAHWRDPNDAWGQTVVFVVMNAL